METPQKDRVSRVLGPLDHLHRQALQSGSLSKKSKELIALATAIAAGSETSIVYHLHNALEAGASHQEIGETLDVTMVTLGEPAVIHSSQILKALEAEDGTTAPQVQTQATIHPYMQPD